MKIKQKLCILHYWQIFDHVSFFLIQTLIFMYCIFYILGKTTLINKIWGVGGQGGLFDHTEVPTTYQINNRVYVVDFPGSNSLDYHAKTFSICGAMNNMIIVLIPFTGDLNQMISDELSKVFMVMKGIAKSVVEP